jgi:hypothetical protein
VLNIIFNNFIKRQPVFTLVTVQGAVAIIYTNGGLQQFRSPFAATECKLGLPDGGTCMYNPGTTPTPHKTCTFPNMGLYNYCIFQVDVTSRLLSGVYKLTYKGTDGVTSEDTYNLYLRGGKKELFQSSSVSFGLYYEIRASLKIVGNNGAK